MITSAHEPGTQLDPDSPSGAETGTGSETNPKLVSDRVQQNRDSKLLFTCRHKKGAMLQLYALSGKLLESCKRVGVTSQCHYYWLKSDDVYAAEFVQAKEMAADKFEGDIVHQGYEVEKPNALLAMFHMKMLRPEYRDNHTIDVNLKHTITVEDARKEIEALVLRNPGLLKLVGPDPIYIDTDDDVIDVEPETEGVGPPNGDSR